MNTFKRWIRFVVGLIIVSFGIVFTIKAGLGVSPWDVFHVGLTNYFNITVGIAGQVTGFSILILSFLIAKIKPTLGTVINILLIGVGIDYVMLLIPEPTIIVMKYFYLIIGIIVIGFGVGIYISAKCGTGPRDSLMMALDEKLSFDISLIRSSMELMALLVGYLLGGPVGVGTILTAIAIGPVVGVSLKLIANL